MFSETAPQIDVVTEQLLQPESRPVPERAAAAADVYIPPDLMSPRPSTSTAKWNAAMLRNRARGKISALRENKQITTFLSYMLVVYHWILRKRDTITNRGRKVIEMRVNNVEEFGNVPLKDRMIAKAYLYFENRNSLGILVSIVVAYVIGRYIVNGISQAKRIERFDNITFEQTPFSKLIRMTSSDVEMFMPFSTAHTSYVLPLSDKGIAFYARHAEFPCSQFMNCTYTYGSEQAARSALTLRDTKTPITTVFDFANGISAASFRGMNRVLKAFVPGSPITVDAATSVPACTFSLCVVSAYPRPVLLMTIVQRMITQMMSSSALTCTNAYEFGYPIKVFVMTKFLRDKHTQIVTPMYEIFANPEHVGVGTNDTIIAYNEVNDGMDSNRTQQYAVNRYASVKFSAVHWNVNRWVRIDQKMELNVRRAACIQRVSNRFSGSVPSVEHIISAYNSHSNGTDGAETPVLPTPAPFPWSEIIFREHTPFSETQLHLFSSLK